MSLPRTILAGALLLGLLGCGALDGFDNGGDDDLSTQPDAGTDTSPPELPPACSNDLQCDTSLCIGGECVACGGQAVCNESRVCLNGDCVDCIEDADCADGAACLDNVCVADAECLDQAACDSLGADLACFAGDCISETPPAPAFSAGGGFSAANDGSNLYMWSSTGPGVAITGSSSAGDIHHIAGPAIPVLTGPGGAR